MDGEALFWLELALALPALIAALALKPWRMLHGPLLTPTLAAGAIAMSSESVVGKALHLRRWQRSGPARG